MKKVKFKAVSILRNLLLLMALSFVSTNAQSTNVDYPTPITTDSISGKIKARDIGDSRSTVHYYVFEGNQGDIFLKIEATNLNGDIDIFYADNLRPLTKISLYADSSPTQTAREIYLRKPEKLILRVEGRTPNDDPASYTIKFEGNFIAMASNLITEEPKLPEVKNETESEVKVNSVGTIIETEPKADPTPKETVARNTSRRGRRGVTTPQPVSTVKPKTTKAKKEEPKTDESTEPEKKIEVVVTDTLPKASETEKTETNASETANEVEPKAKITKKRPTKTTKKTTAKRESVAKKETAPPKPNPAAELAKALENVRLVVEFKDGAKIERPMNEVVRFSVDKGILTIVNKDGTIGKYSILDVAKISIE